MKIFFPLSFLQFAEYIVKLYVLFVTFFAGRQTNPNCHTQGERFAVVLLTENAAEEVKVDLKSKCYRKAISLIDNKHLSAKCISAFFRACVDRLSEGTCKSCCMVRACVRSDNALADARALSRVHMHEPCYNSLVTFVCF